MKQQDQTFMPQQIGCQSHYDLFTNICQCSELHCAATANVAVKISKVKSGSLKARGRSGKCCFEHVQFVHVSHDQQGSYSEHIYLTGKAESCKDFRFFLALTNKQVCFSKTLLWHAYSTSPACILTALYSGGY